VLSLFLVAVTGVRLSKSGEAVKAGFPLLRSRLVLLGGVLARLSWLTARIPPTHRALHEIAWRVGLDTDRSKNGAKPACVRVTHAATSDTLPQSPENAMSVGQRKAARRRIIARNKHKRRVPIKQAFEAKPKGAKK
jgi:hypothetical protein